MFKWLAVGAAASTLVPFSRFPPPLHAADLMTSPHNL